jgi:chromate reductase
MHLLNQPEVMIAHCQERFDAEGRLVDEKTRQIVAQLLAALGDWTRWLRTGVQDAYQRP